MSADWLSAAAGRFDPTPKGAARWLGDPLGFARECVEWSAADGLTDYQAETLDRVGTERRVAVRGPHGLGKSAAASLLVHWFALTSDAAEIDWKVVTTAGSWRQLTEYLWPEIHKWARRLRWDVLGRAPYDPRRELQDLSLQLGHGSAFAAASNRPELLEGAHADRLLYVFDEAKAIDGAVFDAAEGAFSGATGGRQAFAVALSTPGEPVGRFYDLHRHAPGLEDWWTRHVTLTDAVAAGRVSAEWAEQRRLQWGEGSALYANRVLGEFHSADEDAVVPLAWIEAAVERWRAWDRRGRPEPAGRAVVGVDVARSGSDKTVLALRQGDVVTELRRYALADTMATTGRVQAALACFGGPSVAVVDVIGVGAGVHDRLTEQYQASVAFNASERPQRRDRTGQLRFANTRAAAWWRVRELLDPGYGATVALPPDDQLVGDLTAPHWRIDSSGRVLVEPKDDIRRRLGRSTDSGDAVVQALWVDAAPISEFTSPIAVPYSDARVPGGAIPWGAPTAEDQWLSERTWITAADVRGMSWPGDW